MISGVDHVVLTVTDIERSVLFFQRALQAEVLTFGGGRKAIRVGGQKLNLQTLGQETRNKAAIGSGDLCLITKWPLEKVKDHLEACGIEILEGPVEKSGAKGKIYSLYFNDPDQNLIEISVYA